MNPAEVFEKAAQEIERRGHHKGNYGSDHNNPGGCRVCLYGALNAVLFGNPYSEEPFPQDVDGPLQIKFGSFVDGWNDAPGRTAFDVIDALRDLAREVTS